MKIPDKAYYPEFIGYTSISYFPRENSSEDSLKEIRLPKWLSALIQSEIKYAVKSGGAQIRRNIREALEG